MSALLDGKSALVTGGASGIGRATAIAMCREGARVLILDVDATGAAETAGLITAAGGEAIALPGDVTREADVAAMVAHAVTALGRLDCAFNNAGIAPSAVGQPGLRTHELPEASWTGLLAVNLKGVFLCMKHELAQMLAQGGGAIVNTASVAGLVGLPGASAYSASKHAVLGATKSAALEYVKDNIRVNAVCPGYIRTPMAKGPLERKGDQLLAAIPAGRLGEPEEVAEAVVWLCSDRASFVTGVAWTVDGGYNAS